MESLAPEVAPFGIATTVVEPGFFRTELLSKDSTRYAEPSIEDYRESTTATIAAWSGMSGQQGGDPAKLARALVQLTDARRSRPRAGSPAPTPSRPSRARPPSCSPRSTRTASCPADLAHDEPALPDRTPDVRPARADRTAAPAAHHHTEMTPCGTPPDRHRHDGLNLALVTTVFGTEPGRPELGRRPPGRRRADHRREDARAAPAAGRRRPRPRRDRDRPARRGQRTDPERLPLRTVRRERRDRYVHSSDAVIAELF